MRVVFVFTDLLINDIKQLIIMTVICLHDKTVIAKFFQQNPASHIYSLGDLDDFFWPYTTWYASMHADEPQAIVLVYSGQPLPIILALSDKVTIMIELLRSISHLLPYRFYAHLSPGLEQVFMEGYILKPHGKHYKMVLQNQSFIHPPADDMIVRLSTADLPAIERLYQIAYPNSWFDSRMLETNQYFGAWQDEQLISIAGIHVYSETYRVAALGNITTHPAYRSQGHAQQVTARLCQSLSKTVDLIGLNVKADNHSAIACYRKLGFGVVASYNEVTVSRN